LDMPGNKGLKKKVGGGKSPVGTFRLQRKNIGLPGVAVGPTKIPTSGLGKWTQGGGKCKWRTEKERKTGSETFSQELKVVTKGTHGKKRGKGGRKPRTKDAAGGIYV